MKQQIILSVLEKLLAMVGDSKAAKAVTSMFREYKWEINVHISIEGCKFVFFQVLFP